MSLNLWGQNKVKIYFLALLICIYPGTIFAILGKATCSLSVQNLDFGTINPFDYTPETGNITISVTCRNDGGILGDLGDIIIIGQAIVNYTLTFSTGSSGSFSNRLLVLNPTSKMSYNIYKDTAYTQALGNGLSSSYTLTKNYVLNPKQSQTDTFIIYGKIPVQPFISAGTFTDDITVTLTY